MPIESGKVETVGVEAAAVMAYLPQIPLIRQLGMVAVMVLPARTPIEAIPHLTQPLQSHQMAALGKKSLLARLREMLFHFLRCHHTVQAEAEETG
jgi:hypothetical protein